MGSHLKGKGKLTLEREKGEKKKGWIVYSREEEGFLKAQKKLHSSRGGG